MGEEAEQERRMSGVYIRNIDIPEIKRGVAAIINIDDILFFKTADDILLVSDHGDLVDRDTLKADLGITDWGCDKCQWGRKVGGQFVCTRDDFSDACFFLENAEAVIPAERSEE